MTSPATLIEYLSGHANERPDEIALCEIRNAGQRRVLSWRELHQAAQAVAQRLRRDSPGQTVVIALPNRVEAQIALLGALWSGANTFPLSPLTPASEFCRQTDPLGKCVLVADDDLCDNLGTSFASTLAAKSIAVRTGSAQVRVPDHSLASSILLSSSGTTGQPKIVRRGMRSLVPLGRHLAEVLPLCAADRMLVTIPLCHSYGIDMVLTAATVAGCELELHRPYLPSTARAALSRGDITVWPAVPLMIDTVSRGGEPAGPHRLRLAISAGSPLPQRVYDQFVRAFDTPIGQIYGASEFGAVFYNSPEIAPFDPGAMGRPLAGVEARIVDTEQPDLGKPLAPDALGEIAIRAPTMLSEYLGHGDGPDRNGFLRTGDLGVLDAEGVLRLRGRIKLLIDVGAQKVNPLEVEAVLAQHPSVAEAVVVAVPYSDTANRLKAVVLAREGQRIDPTALRAYLREHLIAYKIPRSIEVRTTLPRSSSGKILREVLHAESSAASR